uniref:Putative secreted protein n=1 Tax=Ixodes scapularis TaxID=6945 RepID=A0A4D5RXC9_IXOSC
MLPAIRATKFSLCLKLCTLVCITCFSCATFAQACRRACPASEEELNSTGRGVLSFTRTRYSYRPFHLGSYLTGGHGALTHMVP